VNNPSRERYEVERQALEARAQALHDSAARIEASRTWRWRLIAWRQAIGRILLRTASGRAVLARLRRSADALRLEEAEQIEVDRELQRQEAEQLLDRFLAGDARLAFTNVASPRVSIILVFYNQAALSLKCLRSLLAHVDLAAEIIIVDNASSDQTAALLERLDNVRLIRNPDNLGFVEAVNQAAKVANGDHLLLLNNDAELTPGALTAAVRTLESADDIGAVGARIVLLDGRLQEAGSIIWTDGSCSGYGRGQQPEKPEFMFRRDVDYCSGAFLLTPRPLFEELGGLDAVYSPAYYEETDYCVRLRKRGYRTVYEPQALIRHFEFASSGGFAMAGELQHRHREIFRGRHQDFLRQQHPFSDDRMMLARTAGRRRHLLYIDDRVPHSSLGAGYPRCREILRALVDMGFQVTLFPLQEPRDNWDAVYKTLPAEIEVMLGLGPEKLAEFLARRKGLYEKVIVSRAFNMEIVAPLLKRDPSLCEGAELIYDAEALMAPREAQRLRLIGHPVSEATATTMVADEIALAAPAKSVIAVSESEADQYRQAGHKDVSVLGHSVPMSLTEARLVHRAGLLFVGALRHAESPNVDSLNWFCDKVLPLLEPQLPDQALLWVAGDASPDLIGRHAGGRVRFVGRTDDLGPLYSTCRVFIAPTRFAAGIPHKVHEAAAHGIPVVATSILAGQLGWHHRDELLVADDAQQFAACCAEL
ncbi:MAG: glycosyltransferase, partial [Wenzhouxiangella sp.]